MAGDIGLVHDAMDQLRELAFSLKRLLVLSLDGVYDSGVVDGNQIGTGAVERVREPARLADERPALGADGLAAIVRKVDQAAFIEDLAIRQVARKQGPFAADVVDHLARVGDLFVAQNVAVVDQPEAGLVVQWDHPEPLPLGTKVAGGQEKWEVTGRAPLAIVEYL